MTNKTFVKITNRDIYEEVQALRKDFNMIKSKVKLNTWISTTALSLVVGLMIGLIVT